MQGRCRRLEKNKKYEMIVLGILVPEAAPHGQGDGKGVTIRTLEVFRLSETRHRSQVD